MRRTAGLLLIGIAIAGAAVLATRPTYVRLDAPSDGERTGRADAGPAANSPPPEAATSRVPGPPAANEMPPAAPDRKADTPDAAGLARSPSGRAPVVAARATPEPETAPGGGPVRPPASAPGLVFADPPEFAAKAFVPDPSGPRDVHAIVGNVLRPDRTPAIGLTVRLVEREKGDEVNRDRPIDPARLSRRRVLGRTTTSATGAFGFLGVNVDEVIAVVDRSPGLAHATGQPRLSRRDGPASVVLHPSWRTVLRVTDPEGVAVPSADVVFFDRVGPALVPTPGVRPRDPIRHGTTDARGDVEFLGAPAPGVEGRLVVTPGRVPPVLVREIERFVWADATIVLPRAYTVRGVVHDTRPVRRSAGRPLQEIAAWFRVEGRPWTPIEIGDDGAFTLRALARGPVRLIAHPKDLRALDEAARETVVAAGAEDVALEVDAGETFEVRVDDLVASPNEGNVRGQACWKLHGVDASPTNVAYRELDGEGVAEIRGVRPGDALDVYIPQAGIGDRCVYETGLPGARRRIAVKTKPLLELDGRIEGVVPEMLQRSRLIARADGWDFWPAGTVDAIRGYVPPVASLHVSFETRWAKGGTWELAEGHADVDPRRPFTIRVEAVAKR